MDRDGLGKCNAQIFVGIYWSIVDAHFVMQMRAGTAAGLAYVGDYIAALDALASAYRISRQVTEARADSVAVINGQHSAISAHGLGEHHDAIGRGEYLVPVVGGDVYAAVERAFTIEW